MEDHAIVFSPHAKDSMQKRGATKEEVEHVIRTASWIEARKGRYEAKLDFPFSAEWNSRSYSVKQVNPVFVVDNDTIVVITVFTFYF